ncbi:MAG: 50S ribosomal protein L4 [bacterium]|nr:50S ribosomal protein L4 [bacterium]
MAEKKLKVAKKVVKASKTVAKSVAKTPVKKVKVEAEISVSASNAAAAKSTKTGSLNVSVFDIKGKVVENFDLPSEIFAAKINNPLMSQAVRVYLANQRQGTSKTQNRGEVNRTTKKVYQQKGTGRARHGSRRAPLYVGGGRVFGPTPRDLSLNISKKMKTLALFSALSSKLKDNEIKIIKGLAAIEPKTKLMAEVLKNLGIEDKRILFIMPRAGKDSQNVFRASRNIDGIQILTANTINTYKILDNTSILLMKDSIDVIKETFLKGGKE